MKRRFIGGPWHGHLVDMAYAGECDTYKVPISVPVRASLTYDLRVANELQVCTYRRRSINFGVSQLLTLMVAEGLSDGDALFGACALLAGQ